VIGDFFLLFGLPSLLTSLIWLNQKALGRLGPQSTYLRRRIFGAIFLGILLVVVLGLVALVAMIANSPSGGEGSSALGRKFGMFIFIELPIIYGFGLRTEDGFLRSVFVSYASLTPQAKERLISGNLASSNKV
jgi:hypothetical protein